MRSKRQRTAEECQNADVGERSPTTLLRLWHTPTDDDIKHNGLTDIQGDHLSGKPANVREFDSCQGNVRDFTKSQGSVGGGRILSGKSGLKLFIVSCIFASILDFAEFMHFILVFDHALLHSYPTTDNNTNTGMIWVTVKTGRSAANRQGHVMEFHVVCRVVTLDIARLFSESANLHQGI